MVFMTYTQWELLLMINRDNRDGFRPSKQRCKKSVLDACVAKGWIKENDDGTVEVTDKGRIDAEENITTLY
jgi:hypothetical protein